MGDVDALCKRIVIIDKGSVLYDNNIENLRKFFGAYRTLKVMFGNEAPGRNQEIMKDAAVKLQEQLCERFPDAKTISVSVDEEWINVLINEDEVPMMKVLNYIQEIWKIHNVKLEEISTESIIKKIYEGGVR